MARTTIAIDDDLLRRLWQRAAREERTLQDVVNDLLRQGLSARRRESFSLALRGWSGELQPGVDPNDRDRVFDASTTTR